MSDQEQDQDFRQRWDFRRNESDLDSSSDDHSGPGSVSEPKRKKHKVVRNLISEENNQEATDRRNSPCSDTLVETHLSFEEANKEPKPSSKKHDLSKAMNKQTKGRSKEPKIMPSDHEPFDAAMSDLRGYSVSLIEGIKAAREDLLKWMSKEMDSPQNGMISSKPNGKGRARTSKSARTNVNKGRGKSGRMTQKQNGDSSEKSVRGKKTSKPTNEEVVEPQKDSENVPTTTTPVASEKQKRKRVGSSEKKQKNAAGNEQTCKTAAHAAAPNYLTLPTVLPRPHVENSERNCSADGIERDDGKRNTMNAAINLSSQSQLTSFPGPLQKDGAFAHNGSRNLGDYEQIIGPKAGNVRGNGNGDGFPFPLAQGLNGGMGIPNSNQLGMQLFGQENRISGLRMNNGGSTTKLPSANHAFLQNYGAFDQHLRFNAQAGIMALHCPDMRGPNMQPK